MTSIWWVLIENVQQSFSFDLFLFWPYVFLSVKQPRKLNHFLLQIVVHKGDYFRGNALLFSSFGGRDFLNNQVNNKCYSSRCVNPMVQEQIVLGDVDEGERVVIVVAATRVVTSSQNFSLVANGESPDPFAPHPLIAHCG
jgi:hypothetical protein